MITTTTTRPAHEETVQLRPGDPPAHSEPRTTLMRVLDVPMNALPKAVSSFDGLTERLRPVNLPVIGKATDTMRQRYLDLDKASGPPSAWGLARIALVLLLSSMPILAIPVEVFGLVSQNVTSIAVIVLTAVLATLVVFLPHKTDMIVGRGLIAGMVACIVYDAARLFAVHVLGLMDDFIPVMGSWVTTEPDTAGAAAVGYIWRYIGDAGGLGVAFFVVAFALGVDRWKNVYAVLFSVAYAVFGAWAGLIVSVAIAPRGEEMMFPLNTATVVITLVGHLIFGFVLGLAFLKAPRGLTRSDWPWTPVLETARAKRLLAAIRR